MRKIKNKKSELEGQKLIFFQLGLIVALLSVFYAFEYRSFETYELPELGYGAIDIPTEFVPPTIHKKKKLPPVPTVNIKIDDTNEIDDELVEIDVGADEITPGNWEPTIEPEQRIEEPEPFVLIPEITPLFPGGHTAMRLFLAENIKYPNLARELGISGTVYLEFIIEKDGSITNITLLREIGGGCDEEAIRVVSMMPKWNPGMQNKKPARVKLALPVKFTLM